MKTFTIDATTGYTPKQTVRVLRNVGKIEDSSSVIRFVSYAMIAVSFALVAYKVFAVSGV